jgi:hypothetical protein
VCKVSWYYSWYVADTENFPLSFPRLRAVFAVQLHMSAFITQRLISHSLSIMLHLKAYCTPFCTMFHLWQSINSTMHNACLSFPTPYVARRTRLFKRLHNWAQNQSAFKNFREGNSDYKTIYNILYLIFGLEDSSGCVCVHEGGWLWICAEKTL